MIARLYLLNVSKTLGKPVLLWHPRSQCNNGVMDKLLLLLTPLELHLLLTTHTHMYIGLLNLVYQNTFRNGKIIN